MKSIGERIKERRYEMGMSIEELGINANVKPDTIMDIEKNGYCYDNNILDKIGKVIKIDLVSFNDIYTRYIELLNKEELNSVIIKRRIEDIKLCLEKFNELPGIKIKEVKQTVIYAQAVIKSIEENKYEESLNIALEGLELYSVEQAIDSIQNKRNPKVYYSLLLCVAGNLEKLNKIDLNIELDEKLFKHFNEYLFADENNEVTVDEKRIYTIVTNNYAYMLFRNKEYERALELCSLALDLCYKLDTSYMLSHLYRLKTKINYKLGNMEESIIYYNIFVKSIENSKYIQLLDEFDEMIENEYTLLKGKLISC